MSIEFTEDEKKALEGSTVVLWVSNDNLTIEIKNYPRVDDMSRVRAFVDITEKLRKEIDGYRKTNN